MSLKVRRNLCLVVVGYPMDYCIYHLSCFSFLFLGYLVWHKQQRDTLTRSNWESRRFLIMLCLDKLGHCGGTADRLKSFVFLLRIAHESQRIFLLYWNMPARIDEFLVPPEGGINWRLPAFMVGRVRGSVSMDGCYRGLSQAVIPVHYSFAGGPPNRKEHVVFPLTNYFC